MPSISLGVGNVGRPRVGLPTLRMVNCYAEGTKEGPENAARIPRPGLDVAYQVGTGPILRQFQQPGFLNGDLFTISAGEIYRNQTFLGAIPFGTNPRMAAIGNSGGQTQLMIVAGGALYCYNGTTLTPVTTFDDGFSPLPPLSGVAVLYDIFIYPVAGTNQFFFSQVGDGTNINADNFGAAQVAPDIIVECQVLAEEILFFNSTTIEFWDYTGNLTAPFAEALGRTYSRGCYAQDSVVRMDNAMFWVGDDLAVYRSSAVPLKVSTPFIDDRLRNAGLGCSQITAFTLSIEGHVFYVMNIPTIGESYAYDCQTQEWAQWGTQISTQPEPSTFIAAQAATTVGQAETIYLGSMTDGTVFTLNPSSNFDGATNKRVVVSGAIWMTEGAKRCNNVALHCVRGVGNEDAPDPIVEMRLSSDGGRTFTSWMQMELGKIGAYRTKAVYRNLGLMRQPGFLFEFAVSDPVYFVAEGASYNVGRP